MAKWGPFYFLVPVVSILLVSDPSPGQGGKALVKGLRRPIALTLAEDGTRLLAANRDSGTIAMVDTERLKVIGEIHVGGKPSDLAAAGNFLLVTDEAAGELVVLSQKKKDSFKEVRRQKIGLSPVSVRISADGKHAVVACLWPRRLAILDLALLLSTPEKNPPGNESVTPTLDLPFAPRRLLPLPGSPRFIVADAFAGKLAVVDPAQKKVESIRSLPVHNIRGLTLDRNGKYLWLTHQMLNGRGHTTPGEIRTSNVLTNNVRRLALADLINPLADISGSEGLYQLGGVEKGAGDPAEIAETSAGQFLVAIAGANELALGQPDQALWTHLDVGRRPTALTVDPKRGRAYLANTFSDSISVVDCQAARVIAEVPLGAPLKDLRPEDRGEMLFFDAALSFETWFSCHSCHPDGHTNGRLNDNFSDGSFGTPKRVLSLLGVKDSGPWAWNGKMPDLETQVRTSLKTTMRGPQPAEKDVQALTAYLRTLPPPPSLLQARGVIDAEALKRGKKIFTQQKCATCHAPPVYTFAKTFDVGIHDELGGKLFNPPSLRGLSQTGPYFHDNRALNLPEVFTRFNHQLSGKLTNQELDDLLYFLHSL